MDIVFVGWDNDYEQIEIDSVKKRIAAKHLKIPGYVKKLSRLLNGLLGANSPDIFHCYFYLKGIKKFDLIVIQDNRRLSFVPKCYPDRAVVIFKNLVRPSTKPFLTSRKCFTFDRGDAAKYGIALYDSYIPSLDYIRENRPAVTVDFSFFGKPKNRRREVNLIAERLSPWEGRVVFNDGKNIKYVQYIAEQYSGKVALEVTQRGQLAPTMRVVEAFALGRKVISNNQALRNTSAFESGNILIFDSEVSYSDLEAFFMSPFHEVEDDWLRRREAKYALSEIISRVFWNSDPAHSK